jgi:integrase
MLGKIISLYRTPRLLFLFDSLRRTAAWRVTKTPLVEGRLWSESHQLYRDKDQQGSRCANGANRLESLLKLNQQSGDAEFVFTNPDTGTRYTNIKKSFSAACREASISNFTFHDLRHTFGTRLADASVDDVKIKELMGHASTMRYIHAADQGKRGAIVVLSEYRQRQRHKFVTNEERQAVRPAVNHC